MHKAGSSIADQIIMLFCIGKQYKIESMPEAAKPSPLSETEYCITKQQEMQISGYYYGMFRGPYVKDMPRLRQLKLIIQVRDPRDCITSAYYSYLISHKIPENPEKKQQFLSRRKKIEKMSIDAFAAAHAHEYQQRLSVLIDLLSKHDDMLLLKYEDMVEQTEGWLQQLSSFIGQPIKGKVGDAIHAKADFKVEKEDPNNHRRQITPGDYIRKLRAETIDALNVRMAEQMLFFGYQ